jgi:demethoxyubiquinone hydroxylase (CLK1/Coq7/Cat5 family)
VVCGSYALGTIAARMGDGRSLGFVVETERQVEAHLASHLQELPPQDAKSRAIVDQMPSMKSNTAPPPSDWAPSTPRRRSKR